MSCPGRVKPEGCNIGAGPTLGSHSAGEQVQEAAVLGSQVSYAGIVGVHQQRPHVQRPILLAIFAITCMIAPRN